MDCCSGNKNKKKPFWKNPMVIIALIGIAYWLYTYHFEHALGFLPYAILLLCPLMHVFMHGGHGSHNHGGSESHEHKGEKHDHQQEKK